MCGFIGSFPSKDKNSVSKGLFKILHRGPDDNNIIESEMGVYGHCRLAIIDVDSGIQPMEYKDHLIVFNGEIYNHQNLRSLTDEEFSTDSDTETILRLYLKYGPEIVNKFNGMFSFAIINKNSLFLARDPIGIKPLYYIINEDTIYFASEIKALSGLGGRIIEFPSGTYWHSNFGFKKYYDFSNSLIPNLKTDPFLEEDLIKIKDSLKKAVNLRLIVDENVPLGVALSGGLDSSIITALAREQKDPLDTFAVGTLGCKDLELSLMVSEYLDTNHHTYLYDAEDILKALPTVIKHLESFDAALIRSAVPNYFLAKLASKYVKVILTGEGADELFGGYKYMSEISNPYEFQSELYNLISNLHNTNLQRTDRMTMAFSLEARVPFLDKNVIETSLGIPVTWKLHHKKRVEKYILREAFKDMLPYEIIHRPKEKFSHGAGSKDLMANHAENQISNKEFDKEKNIGKNTILRSKEELLYYRIFNDIFGDSINPETVGRTRSILKDELIKI
ncbi:MAG: asparagine synthase B [Candidatus Methanofastidiosa archaeon]|nr:asparagine synthase B [Candidatus Methanofastidiosa archaeon]NYT13513.1 asparagine synthase B [Candidatus Methanofastidiosa archaeon]